MTEDMEFRAYLRGWKEGKNDGVRAAASIALGLSDEIGEEIAAAILELCSTEAGNEPLETRQDAGQDRSRSDER